MSLQVVSTVRRDNVQCLTKRRFLCTILTYKDVSGCKFSHRRTCLYVTCHLISHVLSRLPRFHTNVSFTRRVHAHVRTLQDECLHTFWLTKTCLCVTFNIWHHLFQLTFVVKTTYHHTTLTYEPSPYPTFDTCLRTLILLIHRTVFTVKRRASRPLFDLHDHVRVQILTHEPMSVCSFEHNVPLLRLMRRVSTSCINCETWQCAMFD